MIKVLHVVDQLVVGGTEVLTTNIVNSLVNTDSIEPFLLVTRKEGPLKKNISDKVNYLFLPKKSTLDLKFHLNFANYIRQNNIDIIHAHNTSFFSCVLVKLLLLNKIKLIWHNHTGPYINLKGRKLLILKLSSFFFNAIINVNKKLSHWSKEKLYSESIFTLNNFAVFTNSDKTTKLKGIEGKRIVCLAGLRPVKRHTDLIAAFKNVLRKYPDWSLHLIGKDYQDEHSFEILNLILDENLEEHVYFYGLRHDIKNILNQATIGTLVSEREGFPLSILEYGLANLPVVLTDVGNNKNLVNHNKAIVNPLDIKELTLRLIMFIEDVQLRKDVSNSLHRNVVETYSEAYFINSLKDIYYNV